MDSLIGVRDFQNMLKSTLNISSRARMSAVCKSSRNLCDAKAAKAHVLKIAESKDAFWVGLIQASSKFDEFENNSFEYMSSSALHDALIRLVQRLESRVNEEPDNLVFLAKIGLLVIAFAMDNPEYAEYLKKLGDREPLSREEMAALSREFSESGLSDSTEFIDDFPRVAEVVRELLAMQKDRDVHRDLQFMLNIVRTNYFGTFREYKALQRDMLVAFDRLSKLVKALDQRSLNNIIQDTRSQLESWRTSRSEAVNNIKANLQRLITTLRALIPPK
jgi:hypothetical protein